MRLKIKTPCISAGETAQITVSVEGQGLSANLNWLTLLINETPSSDYHYKEQQAVQFGYLDANQPHHLVFNLLLPDEATQYTLGFCADIGQQTKRVEGLCEVRFSAEQLWTLGQRKDALEQEIRKEWLLTYQDDFLQANNDLATLSELLLFYQSLQTLHPDNTILSDYINRSVVSAFSPTDHPSKHHQVNQTTFLEDVNKQHATHSFTQFFGLKESNHPTTSNAPLLPVTAKRFNLSPYGSGVVKEIIHEGKLFTLYRIEIGGEIFCLKAPSIFSNNKEIYGSEYHGIETSLWLGSKQLIGDLDKTITLKQKNDLLFSLLLIEGELIRLTKGAWNHDIIGLGSWDGLSECHQYNSSWGLGSNRFMPVMLMPYYAAMHLSAFSLQDQRELFPNILPSLWDALCVMTHGDLSLDNILINKADNIFHLIDPAVLLSSRSLGEGLYANDFSIFTTNAANYPLISPFEKKQQDHQEKHSDLEAYLEYYFFNNIMDHQHNLPSRPLSLAKHFRLTTQTSPHPADLLALGLIYYRLLTGDELFLKSGVLEIPLWYGKYGEYSKLELGENYSIINGLLAKNYIQTEINKHDLPKNEKKLLEALINLRFLTKNNLIEHCRFTAEKQTTAKKKAKKNHAIKNSCNIIGIDLGTTHSVISVIDTDNGMPHIIKNTEGNILLPSVISFLNNAVLVGEKAKNKAIENPKDTLYGIKPLLGYPFDKLKNSVDLSLYTTIKADNGDTWIEIKGKQLSPVEILAYLLKEIKKIAEAYLGKEITETVISVPSNFNYYQYELMKKSGEIAGLNIKRCISEPSAAALSYGYHKKAKEDCTLAVYCLGGGTVSVSIIEIASIDDELQYEVLATCGNALLGGQNFDNKIMHYLINHFKTEHQIDLSNDPLALQRLRQAAEKAKIELSTINNTTVHLPYISTDISGAKHLQIQLSRKRLETLVEGLIQQTIDYCATTLANSELSIAEIDDIILVGKQTLMPKIEEDIEHFFAKKASKKINTKTAVAMGVAIQAGYLSGDITNTLLLDATSLPLGIETIGGTMAILIDKNTTLPTFATQIFSTAEDNQAAIILHVFQGEHEKVTDNVSLGSFEIKNIPLQPRGTPQIEVSFNIEVNHELFVSARDVYTGGEMLIEKRIV
jgi:molecular chaperone DnaK